MTAQGFPTTTAPLPPRRQARTLGSGLADADNALNLVRLVLALAVIVAHTGPIAGIDWPMWFDWFGLLAVDGFFAISGYLIVGSRLRSSWYSYVIRRFFRIYPAFWMQLALVALVIMPIGAALSGGRWVLREVLGYATNWFTLFNQLPGFSPQWGVASIDPPFNRPWNGSSWSLMYELLAYIGCLVLFSIPWCRRHVAATATVSLLAIMGFNIAAALVLDIGTLSFLLIGRLSAFFMAGVLAYGLRDRIPTRWPLLAASALLVVAICFMPLAENWLPLPLTYLVLGAGVLLPWRIGMHNDISYGVYIYAFPIQQLMAFLHLGQISPLLHLGASVALTVVNALVSWRLIEKPAMGLGRLLIAAIRRRSGDRGSRAAGPI